ncbi:MAG TPA: putative LPS assembly protein LptD [Ferruginibacter sp.]|nr:putative LPS assembly protein LptD [Ferruginibacter sp.]HMP21999.1 putative LPS assembly protein LptD [Ferruginibacter sp.]
MLLLSVLTAFSAFSLPGFKNIYKPLTADTIPAVDTGTVTDGYVRDTTSPVLADTLPGASTVSRQDSLDVKMSKDSLDAPVTYKATDSMVLDVPAKRIILYGKESRTKYQDNELTAPQIIYDQQGNTVSAFFLKDSTGRVLASPSFRQGELHTVSDSIRFNMKSGKGLTKGTYTQQGEMYVYGERIKKIDSTSFYSYRSRFTTCNLDTPHFAFVSKKIKFINQKFAVTGPVHPEFEGVPLPVYLPFGIYPMYSGRHSGLIAPNFTASSQFGIGMERLGYYKVINDNWDVTVFGTLYSYGGWMFNASPRYYKRYRYQGNFSIDVQRTKFNFSGDPDFATTQTFNIRWTHTADAKSRPGVTFSANVNAGSSKFNQNLQTNAARNFNNIFGSTVSYARVWKDKPYNLSLSANHSQNTNLNQISVTLPNLGFNLNTIYPFRRKEMVGAAKWYENVGVALNTIASSNTIFYDDTDDTTKNRGPILQQISNNWRWGATHNVPITLSLPPLGPLQVAPGVSYSERWYQQKTILTWDTASKKIDTSISKGLYTAREMSFSLGASTRIFGMFGFGKNSKVQAIRHEIRPQVGISYKPDMNGKFYRTVQADTSGRTVPYNIYQNNNAGAYGPGRFGGLSFSVDNNLQMKVRNKNDTAADAMKKITLIDGFSIGGSYNFLIDSFQFSPLTISARSNLFNKINLTASASSNLYQVDTNGLPVNRLIWKDKPFSLGRLSGGSVTLSTSFTGGDGQKKSTGSSNGRVINPLTGMAETDYEAEAAYMRNNPAEFTDFSIPWSVNLGYSLRFNKTFVRTLKKFQTTFNSDLTFSGTLGLTKQWQVGVNGTYNVSTGEIGYVTMTIAREMHCWQMAISLAPIGRSRYFTITISPKSGLLRDLRVNRSRYFYDL